MVMKASHTFNLLDARGAISVTERATYIGRVRALSRAVAKAYYESREKLGFPDGARTMNTATLLIELLTEELPPKSLARLADVLCRTLSDDLAHDGFLTDQSKSRWYATPRRLAVSISHVLADGPGPRGPGKGTLRKGRAG